MRTACDVVLFDVSLCGKYAKSNEKTDNLALPNTGDNKNSVSTRLDVAIK